MNKYKRKNAKGLFVVFTTLTLMFVFLFGCTTVATQSENIGLVTSIEGTDFDCNVITTIGNYHIDYFHFGSSCDSFRVGNCYALVSLKCTYSDCVDVIKTPICKVGGG